jgi:L-arabinose isomerase
MIWRKKYSLKVGLFGIGLEAYWDQFAGLKERLENYLKVVETKISQYSGEVVNLGLIDNPEKAVAAGHDFRRADVDIIFLYVTTYALSLLCCRLYKGLKCP